MPNITRIQWHYFQGILRCIQSNGVLANFFYFAFGRRKWRKGVRLKLPSSTRKWSICHAGVGHSRSLSIGHVGKQFGSPLHHFTMPESSVDVNYCFPFDFNGIMPVCSSWGCDTTVFTPSKHWQSYAKIQNIRIWGLTSYWDNATDGPGIYMRL